VKAERLSLLVPRQAIAKLQRGGDRDLIIPHIVSPDIFGPPQTPQGGPAPSVDQRFAGARDDFYVPPVDQAPAPSAPEHHLAPRSETPAAPHNFAPRLRHGWHPNDARADEQAVAINHPGIFQKLFGSTSDAQTGSDNSEAIPLKVEGGTFSFRFSSMIKFL